MSLLIDCFKCCKLDIAALYQPDLSTCQANKMRFGLSEL